MPIQEFTEQETKQLISELAAKSNSFKIRVQRRHPSGGSKVIALFEEGTAEQIAFAEKWLPDLAGGGQYSIYAFHASDSMKQIGAPIVLSIDNMPPRDVDTAIVRSSAWIGPMGLSYPQVSKQAPNGATHFEGSGAEATGPQIGAMTPLAGVKTVGTADPLTIALEKAQQYEKQLEAEKARNQIQAIKDQSDRAVAALQQQVNTLVSELREERARAQAQAAAAASATPKETGTDSIAKLIAAITPLVAPLLQSQNEMKVKMMELEARNAQAQLDAAKLAAERIDKFMLASLEKPKGIDPVMQLVLDQLKEKGHGESPLVAMQGALQLITAAKDAGFGGDREQGIGDIVMGVTENLSRAAEAYFTAKANAPAATQTIPVQPQQPQARIPQQPQQRLTAFQHLDRMIRRHHNINEVANYFLDGIVQDREIRERFKQAGNDTETFFKTYWLEWAKSNLIAHGPYVQALNEAVQKAAEARGMAPKAAATPQPAPAAPAATPQPPASSPASAAQQTVAAAVERMQHEPDEEPVDPGEAAHGNGAGDPGDQEDDVEVQELADEEVEATQ